MQTSSDHRYIPYYASSFDRDFNCGFEEGDDAHWRRIHIACEGYEDPGKDLFTGEFGTDLDALKQRVAFICRSDGLPVATNAAWFGDRDGQTWGRIHWVATTREEQGVGLSKPLMTAVCNRLRELGHVNACLTTNIVRFRAILLYAGFGFKPEWANEEEKETWRLVAEKAAELGRRLEL